MGIILGKKKAVLGEINGCKYIRRSSEDEYFPYYSHAIYLDDQDVIGIEYHPGIGQIRIDGVLTSGEEDFIQMMDAVICLADKEGYRQLYFADTLPEEMLQMFMNYGFTEKKVIGDPNRYLYMDISAL